MSDEYRYYIAEGESLDIVEEFFAERETWFARVREWSKSIGGKPMSGRSGGKLYGVVFDTKDDVPAGFAVLPKSKVHWDDKGKVSAAPNMRTKAGKAYAQQWNDLGHLVGVSELTRRLDCGWTTSPNPHGRGELIHYANAEKLAGDWVVSVHESENKHPKDARPIKLSEYYAMKEAEEATQ